MSSLRPPGPDAKALLVRLDALLVEAVGLSDLLGLDLTAIRIEDAMTALRQHDVGRGDHRLMPLH